VKSNIIILSALTLTLISGCKSTAEKEADANSLSNCGLNTYKNYQEIVERNPDKIANLTPGFTFYKGSSMLPFGSRVNAVNEAKLAVCKKELGDALTITDKEKTYSAQQKLIGGVYHIYHLMPFTFSEITEQEVTTQLEKWIKPHSSYFSNYHRERVLELAKNIKFTNLHITLEKLIKNTNAYPNDRNHHKVNGKIVELYVFHRGEIAEKKLITWVKYHKVNSIKLSAYKGLIALEKFDQVETLLAHEDNDYLKKEVGMLLI